MAPETEHSKPATETRLRHAVLAVSVLVGLSALWGGYEAVAVEPKVWGLFGFEAVTLVAAGLGVLVGLGRPREAPALSAACIGATVFAAATLGRFSAIVTRSDSTFSGGQAVTRLLRDPMFDGRLVAAAVLMLIAVMLAFGTDRRSWRKFVTGIVLAVPVVAAGAWLAGPGKSWLLEGETAGGSMVRVLVGVFGGLALTLMAAASVHQTVRAFEIRLPEPPSTQRQTRGKPAAAKRSA